MSIWIARWSKSQLEFGVALAALTVLTAVFFAPLLRGETYEDVGARENEVYPWAAVRRPFPHTLHYDQADQFYPYQVFVNRSLRGGELPLWNPDSFGGQPFFAAENAAIVYPPRLLLAFALPPERVHDALSVLHVLGSGIAMYLLLRTARRTFPARLFGACVWGVNSFSLGWLPFEGLPALAVWLPLGLLLLRRTLVQRCWRSGVGLAVVVALMLSSVFLFGLITLAIFACYGAVSLGGRWWALRAEKPAPLGSLVLRDGLALAPLLLAPALAAVQILPTLELTRAVDRSALPYSEYVKLAVPLQHLFYFFISPPFSFASRYDELGVVHDAVFGNLPYEVLGLTPLVDTYHSLLFLGTPTALLALVGLCARGWLPTLARWLAISSILIAIGTPVAWLAYHLVPGASVLKPLGRFLVFFDFAVAVLAASGVDVLLGWLSRPRRVRPLVSPALRNALIGVLALISLVQLHHVGDRMTRHQPDDPTLLQPATPLVRALREEHPGRILPVALDDALVRFPYDRIFYGASALSLGLPSAGGYEVLLPQRIANLWRVVGEGIPVDRVLSEPLYWSYAPAYGSQHVRYDLLPRLGVTHLVMPPDIERDPLWSPSLMASARPAAVYDGLDGRVYRLSAALPIAYLVTRCEEVGSAGAALARFTDASFDPTQAVIIEAADVATGSAVCSTPGSRASEIPGEAAVVSRSLNSLTFRVVANQAVWLVVAESWDPSWRGTVDGASAALVPGNYAFRAVRVPEGTHLVELRYEPASVRIGGVVTLVALLVLAGLTAWQVVHALRGSRQAAR
ncbi:MAG TPA: hypothetical protein VII06_42995 [Chloroflexota bacterium]|jgi:hypothetical protein